MTLSLQVSADRLGFLKKALIVLRKPGIDQQLDKPDVFLMFWLDVIKKPSSYYQKLRLAYHH